MVNPNPAVGEITMSQGRFMFARTFKIRINISCTDTNTDTKLSSVPAIERSHYNMLKKCRQETLAQFW